MNILIDMCLSPQWAPFLAEADHAAIHWAQVGASDASDREIMDGAQRNEHLVFTHDLDFGALLAATQAESPSVLQVRAEDVLPDTLGSVVLRALRQFEHALHKGALLSVDPEKARVRLLPIGDA